MTSDRIVAVVTNVGPTQKQWIFDEFGALTLPEGSQISETSGVSTNITVNGHTWAFGVDSNLTLPGSIIGNVTGNVIGDVKGSVFGNDLSTMLIDGTGGRIVGDVYTSTLRTSESQIALGNGTAITSQGVRAIAIGQSSGQSSQGNNAVAIGQYAGNEIQGIDAIAVGNNAGYTGQGSIAVAIGTNAGEANQGSAGVAIGYYAGKTTQETGAVAIGYTTAQVTQRQGAVAIGWSAGQTNQGANAIAIGYRAGFTNQNASSIVLNASGAALDAAASGFFVNPVRNQTGASGVVQYDSTTSEISFSSTIGSVSGTFTGNIFTNLIDSADSSAITVTPAVVFNTQVTVEGTLTVNDGITGYISLAELKSVVAASADFADFQIRMAAL